MDYSMVWKAVLALAGLGAFLGAALAVASLRFHVEIDPRVKNVLDILPGTNCGACGFPSCEAAAEAVVDGGARVTICRAGGPDVAAEVGRIMGVKVGSLVPMVAHIHCRGGASLSPIRAIYQGVDSCRAAEMVGGGGKACPYGCIGLMDCAFACPVNAIVYDQEGIRRINSRKCTGCGLCVDVCPRNLIEIVPASARYFVRCKCQYTGKKALSVCKVACIGCKKSMKVCPTGAIRVNNNYAVIDYDKCINCGECCLACPTDSIQEWVEGEGHPEGGEFVIPERKRKKGSQATKSGAQELIATQPTQGGD